MPAIRPRTPVGARVRVERRGVPIEGTLRHKGVSGELWLIQLDDGDCFWAGTETVEPVAVRLCLWGGCRRERGHDGPHFGMPSTETERLADYHEGAIQ